MGYKLPGEAESLPVAKPAQGIVSPAKNYEAEAAARLGGTIAATGETLANVFEQERKRVDKTMVEDAFTELRNKQIDLSIGENGFSQSRSADAVKKPLLKDYSDQFDTAVEDISSRLTNEDQRTAFRLRSDVAKSQFTQDILQHVNKENSAYQSQVLTSTVQTETNAAMLHWNNPSDAMASIERVKAAFNSYADVSGLSGDATIKKAELAKMTSVVHSGVIGKALDEGNAEYAQLWYKTHRDEIDAPTAAKIDDMIKVGGGRIRAQQATDDIMSMNLSEEEAKKLARKKYTGEERDNVVARLNARYTEIAQAQAGQYKQAEDDAWKIVVNPGSTLDSIPTTLWSRMSGESRKQVTDYLVTRDKKERKEDDWAMLDQVEGMIDVGDITDTSDLLRYEPYFKDSTLRSLRKKVEKRGTVSATIVQRSFEDRLGKTRSKWKDRDREQWIAFQGYILDNVKETKRPEDVDVWADKWFSEGYGSEDRLFRDDPNTFGEAVAEGRKDFVIKAPEEAQQDIGNAMELLRKSGVKIPSTDDAADQFYTQHYIDATRWFAARDIVATPDRIAAYAALKSRGAPVTDANIDYIAGQLR